MSRGDKVVIARTALNQYRGLPIGQECIVQDIFEQLGKFNLLAVYDPVAGKSYYVTDDLVDKAA
ncbi:MAG: hypothetical protein V1794_01930 [Candidatus Glassbacteria bacterium]